MKPRVLILCFTPVLRDPRLRRQVEWLAESFDLTVVGFASAGERLDGCLLVPLQIRGDAISRGLFLLTRLLRLHRLADAAYRWTLKGLNAVERRGWDLVIVNDLMPLGTGFRFAHGSPVYFDAHEYYLDVSEVTGKKALYGQSHLAWLARTFIPRVTLMTTVCQGIAELYRRDYGVIAPVILNAPPREDLNVPVMSGGGGFRLVHHGGSNANRRLDRMIDVMRHLGPEYTLDLMLIAHQPVEYERLKRVAADVPNVRFVDPVPMTKIARHLNAHYDIGFYLLEPQNLNQTYALPNKLFEFIQARLAVVTGPAEEMGAILKSWGCGIETSSFEPEIVAREIRSLTRESIVQMRTNSALAAESLNAGTEGIKLRELLAKVVG